MVAVAEVIIPFRDRGNDALRARNLSVVVAQWEDYGMDPYVVSDGRTGKEQFNRSAAYNRGMGICLADADVFIFAESDMLIDSEQIDQAVQMADEETGMVVPFTQYRYLSAEDTEEVCRDPSQAFSRRPMWTMDSGRSIGAINVVSRKTMDLVGGFDEGFEGNWFDDDAMKVAFDVCAGPTRWVEGPAVHLYHQPGHQGSHLGPEDKMATRRNHSRYHLYKQAALLPSAQQRKDRVRQLITGGR